MRCERIGKHTSSTAVARATKTPSRRGWRRRRPGLSVPSTPVSRAFASPPRNPAVLARATHAPVHYWTTHPESSRSAPSRPRRPSSRLLPGGFRSFESLERREPLVLADAPSSRARPPGHARRVVRMYSPRGVVVARDVARPRRRAERARRGLVAPHGVCDSLHATASRALVEQRVSRAHRARVAEPRAAPAQFARLSARDARARTRVGEVDDDAGSRSVGVGRARDGDVSGTSGSDPPRRDLASRLSRRIGRRPQSSRAPAVAAGHARADARGGVARRGRIVVLREWGREAHRASDFVLRHVASARPRSEQRARKNEAEC